MQIPAIWIALALILLSSPSIAAESLQSVKVYRDYPAYIEPPLCDNPRINEASDLAKQGEASEPSSTANGQFYAGGWVGLNSLPSTDLKYASVSVDVEYDHGYGAAAFFGYDFGTLRLELEGAYRSNSVDTLELSDSEATSVSGDLEIRSLALNAYYDIDTGSYITPYLGAGVGWAEVTLDGFKGDGVLLVDDDDSVMAGQLAAGFQFALNQSMALDIGYRFLLSEDLEFKSEYGKVETEGRSHTVAVGIQYRF